MDSIKHVVFGIAAGVRDAILGMTAVFSVDRDELGMSSRHKHRQEEPKVLHRILQCCILNGGVFWLSIFVFHSLVLPSLHALMDILFGGSSNLATAIWLWMKPVLLYTFSTLWVLPLFLLSRIVNSLWFQDIADSAYRQLRGRPQHLPSMSKLVADTLFSVLIQALFLIQSMLVRLLPIASVGHLVSIVHLCLLYSLYAFEYKWFNMGWALHKRLSFIEHNWPYFLGFGLPLAILTSLPSSFIVSGCVFSILFPLFIISGNEATPFPTSCDVPLRLFSPVVYVSNTIFHRTIKSASPTRHAKPDRRKSPPHLSKTKPSAH